MVTSKWAAVAAAYGAAHDVPESLQYGSFSAETIFIGVKFILTVKCDVLPWVS